jgi:hypothetical protein
MGILGIYASQISGHLTPPTFPSYESIATTTPSGSGSITFSSIPSTFKHLQIRCSSVPPTGNYNYLRVNGDSGNNYSFHQLTGDGSNAGAAAITSTNLIYINNYSGTTSPAVAVIDILDYTNTNKYKTVRSLGGVDSNGSGFVQFRTGAWLNTSAITSITIASDGNYGSGSIFALYGIKG